MKEIYEFIRILKLKIRSEISNNTFVTRPGFFVVLALIMLFVMPFLIAQKYSGTTRIMIAVYSLLVIAVVWKFIEYMREKNPRSDLDEIS